MATSSFIDDVLLKLPSELRAKAASLAIYGHDANQMLLTTRDGDLYAVTGFHPEQATNSGGNNVMAQSYCFASSMTASMTAGPTCYSSRIDVLCGKDVCEVAHSPNPNNNRYVLLRTESGELYSFGDSPGPDDPPACCSAPHSKRRSSCLFSHQSCTLVSAHPFLQDKKIVQITCALNHAACLTSCGEIFAWSIAVQYAGSHSSCYPKLPSLSKAASPSTNHKMVQIQTDQTSPNDGLLVPATTKLTLYGCIAKRRSPFVEIASYQDVIVGLDEDGHIYEWPLNEHHMTTSFNKIIELTSEEGMLTCRLLASESIRDVRIVHIAGGRTHCLAVSSSFAVYSWGANDCGQLGLGLPASSVTSPNSPCVSPRIASSSDHHHHSVQNPHYASTPSRVPLFDEQPSTPMKKIKAVSAHSHLDISIAESVTGDVYVWGDLAVSGFSACTSRPTWVRCRSMTEALQTYGRLPFTPSTAFVEVPKPTLTRCLFEAFDNPEHSDIQFIIPGFAPIYGHKQFLQIRSSSFLAAFGSKGWHQGRAILISVDHISYAVVRAFMRFLYTNEFIDGNKQAELDCDDYISLAELAEMCGETLLRKLV